MILLMDWLQKFLAKEVFCKHLKSIRILIDDSGCSATISYSLCPKENARQICGLSVNTQ